MTKKRILEFVTYAGIGGTQQMLLQFLQHASREKYQFYLCVLLEHEFLNDQAEHLHIEQTSLNMRGYWDIIAWWKLYRFAKDKQIDLMRTYGLKAHIVGRVVGRMLDIPVQITSVRSTDPWRKWYHTGLDSVTSSLADLYISNSETGRLATHQRERIPLSKIVTIPNGLDVERYSPLNADEAANYRQSLGISPNASIIGMIATFRKMKGHKTLVDALPRIRGKYPNVRCLLIGGEFVKERSYKQELHQYVREQQLDEAIVFTGSRDDTAALLSICDVVVLPSWWEGFPTSVLEALAMKKPVVASAVGGVPEIIESHKTGILIPPRDPNALAEAVISVLKFPKKASDMGQAGYERVRDHFSLKAMVTKTETIYDQLIEKKWQDKR